MYAASIGDEKVGLAHKSKRFETFEEALENANSISSMYPNVVIERHAEFFDGYHHEWVIDWQKDGGRQHVWPN